MKNKSLLFGLFLYIITCQAFAQSLVDQVIYTVDKKIPTHINLSFILVFFSFMFCLTSCSDDNNDDAVSDTELAYQYFEAKGKMRWDFSKMTQADVNLMLNGIWSRQWIISANNDTTLNRKDLIEITQDATYTLQDATYTLTKEKERYYYRVKNVKLDDKCVSFTLDNDSVIRYDSIFWSTSDCELMSTSKDGTHYIDTKIDWCNSDDSYRWCSRWFNKKY